MNTIKLTYRSATLRQSDISLFNSGNWLNDQCILFYFEYLTTVSPECFLFLDPGASYLLLFEDDLDDLRDALSQVSFLNKTHVFCAINDNNDPSNSGGGHWTLLVYSVLDNQGYYYDSLGMHMTNYENSQNIIHKLAILLNKPSPSLRPIQILENQNNSNDCGVYVLMLSQYFSSTQDFTLSNQSEITRKKAQEFRIYVKNFINSLIS
jgi:sentrin-specific protease 8